MATYQLNHTLLRDRVQAKKDHCSPGKIPSFLRYQLSRWLREQKITIHMVEYFLFVEQIIFRFLIEQAL